MTVQDVRSSGLIGLLLDKAGEYLPPDKVAAIEEAYRFASEAHAGSTASPGTPSSITRSARLCTWPICTSTPLRSRPHCCMT